MVVAAAVVVKPGCEVDEVDVNIEAAAEVVEAIAVADTESGWL